MNPADIQTLHNTYCQLTGYPLRLGTGDRQRAWYEFLKAGFTIEDLRCTLYYLMHGIKHNGRFPAMVGFNRIIWNLDTFEVEMHEARSYWRNNRLQTNRQSVIKVFRPSQAMDDRQAGPTVSCKPVGDIVPKLIEEMRKAAK